MLFKIILTITTALELNKDTSIKSSNLQIVTIGCLQKIINQFIGNRQALKNKINEMGMFKIKILLIKRFSGEKMKFKGFLI